MNLFTNRGKSIFAAGAAAVLAVLACTGLSAGEAGGTASSLTSLRRNAAVHIGGEVRVDYTHVTAKERAEAGSGASRDTKRSDLAVRNANLRLRADVHPNLSAFFKLDLQADAETRRQDEDDILEEAMLVMSAVGGHGLGFFAGKGRAPYGQDITLGMLQSYHHAADRGETSEGRLFITDSPETTGGGGRRLSPMRPGQMDRVFMAGVSYEWHDRWKVELAAFQPGVTRYDERLADRRGGPGAGDIGVAGRFWWQPVEELRLQASAIVARSNDMARTRLRLDVGAGARGASEAKAVSAGFEYRRDVWRVFGEYQHGWDWNFTRGYSTDTWQVGASRDFGEWTAGGMVEGLHIVERGDIKREDEYYKFAFTMRRSFDNGFFMLAEYGREWWRRHGDGMVWGKAHGNFFGMRVGFSF